MLLLMHLLTNTRERAKRASAPETHILLFSCHKNVIFLYGLLQLPLLLLLTLFTS